MERDNLDVELMATTVRDYIQEVPKMLEFNNEEIRQLELERNDYLHLIEMVDFNAVEGFKVYKELQKVMQERRKLKNENEKLKHIVSLFSNIADLNLNKLNQAIGNIRNQKYMQERRTYRCKVRKEFENKINEDRITVKTG